MDPPEYNPGTSEIGSLTAHSNEDSQFVGSSSGVYFINTVKRAFSAGLEASGSPETEFPAAEDTLVGAEDSPRKRQRTASFKHDSATPGEAESPAPWNYDPAIAAFMGKAPPLEGSKELMMMYFRVWHPLFPFLHGPTVLQAMEKLYSSAGHNNPIPDESSDHRSTCWTVILQCIFNLGSLLRPDLELPPTCLIQSTGSVTSLLGSLATSHDIASLQALLAVQVYLVAKMSLRLASTFGGCVLRSMMHAGLHRCPFRYAQLSSHDRQLRKRIFWCAYAIDRYLSQALGLPLGIQDSDIDVCLPAAPEMHSPRRLRELQSSVSSRSSLFHENRKSREHSPVDAGADHRKKESVLASYVDSGTLTGRALELLHKSILVRSVRRSSVLFLVTDVHKWWNSLPLELQGKSSDPGKRVPATDSDSPFDFGPFFTVLYQHLILIIHRPSLSLDPSTAEFCSGLQTCIGAARSILAALKLQVDSCQALFWPGFVSAAWMSGLVLAFACQLKQYVLKKGLQEIDACSGFLKRMSPQWETANHCQIALSLLSTKIKQIERHANSTNPHAYTQRHPGEIHSLDSIEMCRKDLSMAPVVELQANTNQMAEVQNGQPDGLFEDPHLRETRPGLDLSGSFQPSSFNGETVLANNTMPPSELNIQSADLGHFGGSNFDLDMADLLQGADFNSLFDIVGQQYPSF
ncbi:hypothetical protein N7448_003085 [Penicillium atrosanguineum]|nr:hypothetical protein N7448_003085 [Penicillium atrosanguineum]